MFKVVVIDDESKIVKTICSFITENIPDIEIAGIANSVIEGIKLINTNKPDLVLLDIEMPHANGFDLLERLPDREFEVIFITAHNHYAIKAFKVNAVDYILKPVDEEELISAIKKVSKKQKSTKNIDNISRLLKELNSHKPAKLKITTKTGIEYININSIVKIEADGSYSNIFLEMGSVICSSKKIKDFEEGLPQAKFFRSHKSYIVNLENVLKYNNSHNTIVMSDNSIASLARNKKEAFFERMEAFFN